MACQLLVQAQKLSLLKRVEARLEPYPHQAVMLDERDKHKTFFPNSEEASTVASDGHGRSVQAFAEGVANGADPDQSAVASLGGGSPACGNPWAMRVFSFPLTTEAGGRECAGRI